MEYKNIPIRDLLMDRRVFQIFDSEFSKSKWLNLSALQESESSIADMVADHTIPDDIMKSIEEQLSNYYG